jgi:hypothetical protein
MEGPNHRQNRTAIQGAGIQAAENVARTGAEFVLMGHCGTEHIVLNV